MNSYSIDLTKLNEEDGTYTSGGFAEHFLIGYATSPDFRVDTDLIISAVETNVSLVSNTVISFRSSFLIDKLRQEGCLSVRDTTQNKSIESFNKPYAVAKRVVVLSKVSTSNSVDESKFNADIGDFMHFTLPFGRFDGNALEQYYLHIIVGVLNSSLTESYTPLEQWTDTKLYFDFADFKKLTPNTSDAILEQVGGFSTVGASGLASGGITGSVPGTIPLISMPVNPGRLAGVNSILNP